MGGVSPIGFGHNLLQSGKQFLCDLCGHFVGYPVKVARFLMNRAVGLSFLCFRNNRASVCLASCPPFTREGDRVRSICFSVGVMVLVVLVLFCEEVTGRLLKS